ncbi:unnamed protein product [Cuscuta epithymum]|uniref:Uncharacterized protein n=1 Tax=Cuscuta epithymum TaxID=186058 RepID=A0AAV0E5F4_9ASTE|nr:unnamed protein product [Cuscuta epithymum]CAH9129314.1 unnamed protein product [Cuscuta epithymum]
MPPKTTALSMNLRSKLPPTHPL